MIVILLVLGTKRINQLVLDLKRVYAEFIESEQEKRNKKYESHKDWLGASSSGYCFKKQYYKLSNVETEELDTRVSRLLRLGTIVHSDIEKAIKAYNKSHKTEIMTEKRVKIPSLKVIGHIDILEQDGDINRVYDFKTVASYKWRMKFRRINADPNADINYNLQLGTYGLAVHKKDTNINNTELYLCWYNKDNSSMKHPIQVNSIWIEKAEKYWKNLWQSIDKWTSINIHPDEIQVPDVFGSPMQQWECNYCQYSYRCNSPYITKKQIKEKVNASINT